MTIKTILILVILLLATVVQAADITDVICRPRKATANIVIFSLTARHGPTGPSPATSPARKSSTGWKAKKNKCASILI